MGTPHRGSEKASYGKVLAKIATIVMNKPSSRLVPALKRNSDELMRLTSDFKFQLSNYQVVSFYEMKPMKFSSTLVSLITIMIITSNTSCLILQHFRLLGRSLHCGKSMGKIKHRSMKTAQICASLRLAMILHTSSSG